MYDATEGRSKARPIKHPIWCEQYPEFHLDEAGESGMAPAEADERHRGRTFQCDIGESSYRAAIAQPYGLEDGQQTTWDIPLLEFIARDHSGVDLRVEEWMSGDDARRLGQMLLDVADRLDREVKLEQRSLTNQS